MFVTKSITKITAYLLLEMFFLLFYRVKTTILLFWFFFGSFRFDEVSMMVKRNPLIFTFIRLLCLK
ncbi:MAG: hypothetical protein EGP90_04275 [Bacteroides sp.]|nr:hypothetical protein [Bacteroides sp.]RJU31281.1 hypothetical protein DXA05_07915 [Bacteroides sp. AM54-2NS]